MTMEWYDRYLFGDGPAVPSTTAGVSLEVINGKDGASWIDCESWPPPSKNKDLFLVSGGDEAEKQSAGLSLTPAAGPDSLALRYIYDPKDPTPYEGSSWLNLQKDGPADQSTIEGRRDVVVLTSEPLEEDLVVAGEVTATLFMRSSAKQCDVVARLCVVQAAEATDTMGAAEEQAGLLSDLWPIFGGGGTAEARSENVCEGVVRVDFDANLAGEAREVKVRIGATSCRFAAGQRIRLQVCSAAHPKWLRHPLQESGDWLAAERLGPPADMELLAGPAHASRLHLPIWTGV